MLHARLTRNVSLSTVTPMASATRRRAHPTTSESGYILSLPLPSWEVSFLYTCAFSLMLKDRHRYVRNLDQYVPAAPEAATSGAGETSAVLARTGMNMSLNVSLCCANAPLERLPQKHPPNAGDCPQFAHVSSYGRQQQQPRVCLQQSNGFR